MNTEIFVEKIRESYSPFGTVNASRNVKFGEKQIQDIDSVVMRECNNRGFSVMITKVDKELPVVRMNVLGFPTLEYVLGTTTSDIVNKARLRYSNNPEVLEVIERNAEIILCAYKEASGVDSGADSH